MFKTLGRLFVFVLLAASASGSERSDCFPFERLSPELRPAAEALLLKALDNEGLFTIVGGIKPMSSGFVSFRFESRIPRDSNKARERSETLGKLSETREILASFRCGDFLYADVHHFSKTFEGRRFADGVVFHRPAVAAMVTAKRDFFERWGITANSHPLEILYAVEYDESGARFGGYGFLFGYPDYAVDFFVRAAAEEEFTGKFVVRDFVSVPTFESPTNRFVYAVPKGQQETEADRLLKARSDKLLAEYRKRRAEYIGPGKKGAAAMLRDWFCAGESCRPPVY